jgi:uncharacterized protein YndB with AHSA1/START domain
MRIALIVVVVLVGLVAVMALVGAMLPKSHVASRTATYHVAPSAVWAAITDVNAFASWRGDVSRVEMLPDRNGHRVWREHGKNGPITYEAVELTPPTRLVGRIADTNLAFGGSWTYVVSEAEGGARLTITENGEVYNPIFRFMSRFVFGHGATMEDYLRALGKKFNETTVPVPATPDAATASPRSAVSA